MSASIAALVEQAQALPREPPVTIVVANAAYRPILANWLAHARSSGASNMLVAALDIETAAFARQMQVDTCLMPSVRSRAALWRRRVAMFCALAEAGVSFIHTDADAVWLRAPYATVAALDVDLAFSQGTVWPYDVAARRGFVVCCGFFAARGTDGAARFFDLVRRRMFWDHDDQTATNLVLDAVHWQPAMEVERREWKGRTFETYGQARLGANEQFSAAVLPHRIFPRLAEISAETIVAHPIGGVSPERRLRDVGLWRID